MNSLNSMGGVIDTITEQLETLESEVTALKTQLGTQFKYVGEYLCRGIGQQGNPSVETAIKVDYGLYLLFTTQAGSWDEGSMIFVDYPSTPSKATVLYFPKHEYFSVKVGDGGNKQIIITNNALANFVVIIYQVGKRTLY